MKTLKIGVANRESKDFIKAQFVITGGRRRRAVSVDLLSLETIELGDNCFGGSASTVVESV